MGKKNMVAEPVPAAEPVPTAEPVPAAEPIPAAEPVPAAEPAPAAEPEPVPAAEPEPAPAVGADRTAEPYPSGQVPLSEDFFQPTAEKTSEPVTKRGRGRPPGSTNAPKPPSISAPSPDAEILGTAGMIFDLSTGSLTMIFGEEWKPRNESERNFVIAAIANYVKTTGLKELPPKYIMLFAIAAYAAPRFSAPTTKDKIKAIYLWGKMKVGGMVNFLKGRKT